MERKAYERQIRNDNYKSLIEMGYIRNAARDIRKNIVLDLIPENDENYLQEV